MTLIVPTPASVPTSTPGAAVPPANAGDFTTSPSGLFVPSGRLTIPGVGGLVTAGAADIDNAPQIVERAYDDVAAKFGAAAADALLGAELRSADAARLAIEHDRIVAAWMRGDVASAIALARG